MNVKHKLISNKCTDTHTPFYIIWIRSHVSANKF